MKKIKDLSPKQLTCLIRESVSEAIRQFPDSRYKHLELMDLQDVTWNKFVIDHGYYGENYVRVTSPDLNRAQTLWSPEELEKWKKTIEKLYGPHVTVRSSTNKGDARAIIVAEDNPDNKTIVATEKKNYYDAQSRFMQGMTGNWTGD